MPNTSFLVPTRAFFQKPIFDEITGLKQIWLQEKLGVEYRENLSTQQKWTSLIASFSDSIERAGLPFDTQTLRRYQASRLIVLDNQNNLSLAKTLDYFEFFYFFFDNTHPKFSLSQDKKISLLHGLFEAIGFHTCEVGRGARFEAEFNLWLKTNDILFDELYKMRNGIIEELAVRYNTEHHVGEAMSVHTVYAMKKYVANRFGLANIHEVQDVYLSNESRTAIHQYVDTHAQTQFDLYIEEAAQRLNVCVLGQIEELLGLSHENKETLKHSSLKLTSDQYQVMLYPYLGTLLCFSLYEDNRNLVDGITIEDDDELGVFHLERYDILRPKLKFAIEKVLTQKGYFVNLADLSRNQIDAYDLILKKDIDVDMLWSAYQQISSFEIDSDIDFKKHQKVFKAYPQLIVSVIMRPSLEEILLPQAWFYHPIVLDGLMKALIDELAIRPINQVEPHLITILNQLLKVDSKFILKLQPFLNSDFAPPLAYDLNQFLSENNQNINILKRTQNLYLGQVVQLVRHLNPRDLIEIINERRSLGYAPLPYYDKELMEAFEQETDISIWQNLGYQEVRKQAFQRLLTLFEEIDLSVDKERTKLSEMIVSNESWYLAYLQYYQMKKLNKTAFENLQDFVEQIQKNLEVAISLLRNSLNTDVLIRFIVNVRNILNVLLLTIMIPILVFILKIVIVNFLVIFSNFLIVPMINALILNQGIEYFFTLIGFTLIHLGLICFDTLLLTAGISELRLMAGSSPLLSPFVPLIFVSLMMNINLFMTLKFSFLLLFICGLLVNQRVFQAYFSHEQFFSYQGIALDTLVWSLFALNKDYMMPLVGLVFELCKDYILPLVLGINWGILGACLGVAVILKLSYPLLESLAETSIRIFYTLTNFVSRFASQSETECLERKVHAVISHLLLKNSDFAHRKGELLFNLWDKIKDDHANSQEPYENLFNKDYEIEGVTYTFKSVASATRLDEAQFNSQVADNRFGFFRLRGSQAAADLPAYLSPA